MRCEAGGALCPTRYCIWGYATRAGENPIVAHSMRALGEHRRGDFIARETPAGELLIRQVGERQEPLGHCSGLIDTVEESRKAPSETL